MSTRQKICNQLDCLTDDIQNIPSPTKGADSVDHTHMLDLCDLALEIVEASRPVVISAVRVGMTEEETALWNRFEQCEAEFNPQAKWMRTSGVSESLVGAGLIELYQRTFTEPEQKRLKSLMLAIRGSEPVMDFEAEEYMKKDKPFKLTEQADTIRQEALKNYFKAAKLNNLLLDSTLEPLPALETGFVADNSGLDSFHISSFPTLAQRASTFKDRMDTEGTKGTDLKGAFEPFVASVLAMKAAWEMQDALMRTSTD